MSTEVGYQRRAFSQDTWNTFDLTPKVQAAVEYYGSYGSLKQFDPMSETQQQIFPAVNVDFGPEWEFNLGIGRGLTRATDGLLVKMILGYHRGMRLSSTYRLISLAFAATLVSSSAASAQISTREYAARRDSLAARIGNGAVIAFGGRTPVTDFGPFYQLPAFEYLTGFDFPDAVLVLVARGGHAAATLFVEPADPRRAFYYGWRPDSAAVPSHYGMQGRSFGAFAAVADSIATSGMPVYSLGDFEDADFARQDSLTRAREFLTSLASRHQGLAIKDAQPVLSELRARKSPAELALLRKAADISAAGHRAAMQAPEPHYEYELAGALEGTFKRLGAERPAYGLIVGSGINGTQLHYMLDRGPTKPGDVVVIDAAAEFDGYAADITRTIPVSGTYTAAQRQIYQLVRDAQAAAERNAKAGLPAQAAEDSSQDVRARGLAKLGLVQSVDATFDPPWGSAGCARNPRSCRQAYFWMIHGISHGLGLAVHDPAQFNFGDHTYKVGDAFTIEPGIYVSPRMLDALPDTPKNRAFIAFVRPAVEKYMNTGVRIEDDYVITPSGTERITAGVPREMSEIEALMKRRERVVP